MIKVPVLFLLLMTTFSVGAAPTQSDLHQLEQKIKQEQKAQKEISRKADEVSDEVKSVQKQMVRLAQNLREKEDDLSRLEKRQEQIISRQAELQDKLKLTEGQKVRLISGFQTLALRPKELALIQNKTPLNTVRSQMIMGYSLPVINGINQQTRDDLSELSQIQEELKEQIVQIKSAQLQLSEQTEQMNKLLQQKYLLQAQYQVSQQQAKQRVENLGSQAKDLKDLLNRLEEEKKQATQVAIRYMQENRPDFEKTIQQTKTNVSDFSKIKGRLPYPISGKITTRFGTQMVGGGHTKGVTISGRLSAHVTAPFDGTVLFAGPFKSYGSLVILDHGNNYLSLLAGMNAVYASVGQTVLAGEPVGQMGNKKSELYVEIRQGGQAVDPEPWFVK